MTKIKIMCNGKLVNEHSESWGDGYTNPIDKIPPIGSYIEYESFDGFEITTYMVTGLRIKLKESYNNLFDREYIVEVACI